MAKQTEIRVNLDGLTKLRKQLGGGVYARIGILGGGGEHMKVESKTIKGKFHRVASKTPSGMTNADIGVIQEFGSDTAGIHPRSFLRMPIEYCKRRIVKFIGTPEIKDDIERGNVLTVFKKIGIFCEGIVLEAFETQGFGNWAPNAESTIRAKRSDHPLFDSGQLKNSITSDVKEK